MGHMGSESSQAGITSAAGGVQADFQIWLPVSCVPALCAALHCVNLFLLREDSGSGQRWRHCITEGGHLCNHQQHVSRSCGSHPTDSHGVAPQALVDTCLVSALLIVHTHDHCPQSSNWEIVTLPVLDSDVHQAHQVGSKSATFRPNVESVQCAVLLPCKMQFLPYIVVTTLTTRGYMTAIISR